MKKVLLALAVFLISFQSHSQLLSWTPDFITENSDPVVVTVDANKGNQGLLNYSSTSDVYVHTGVITNLSTSSTNWRYVKFNQNFNQPNAALQATYLGSDKWQFTISGGIRAYYGVPPGETILKITFLFRNGDGSKAQRNSDGSDMYIPVYSTDLAVRFTSPLIQPKYVPQPEPITKNVGDNISVTGIANNASTLNLYFNGSVIQTANNATIISANPSIVAAGNQTLVLEANDGLTTKTDTISFFATSTVTVAPLPPGVRDGINYEANTTAATLVLYAPSKTTVSVIGDFAGSNWTQQPAYQMNKTPDGNYWWIHITGLTPGTEYAFQYLVDGTLKIADPYTEKILDQTNDGFISSATYPGLKPYPASATGIVSILQTAAPQYTWQPNNFAKPDKRKLIIYELLLRDFLAAHDWNTLRDTLSYLQNLGVNAIEVMPFNEFEGNNSWGYNPSFYFAPDKYYGPKATLQRFIDSCHSKGIAVIMDIVLNHTYGGSPLAELYWDAPNNRPAANNPWYNPVAPHAFGFGNDFNHSSTATKYFFDRVLQHWITEYKVDGYRVDFSKGLTQKPSSNDATFSAYDASRIAIINSYYNTIKTVDANAYVILEHFCDNTEEKELSDNGMMLWSNVWTQYQEASMGYLGNSNLDWSVYTSRGWTNPHLVTFMESHDEERITFKNIKYGNSSGGYNVKDTATALRRMELNAAFMLSIPGPKMIWEFGELGYDFSRCYLSSNGEGGDCDKKLDPKPIRWDYLQNADRKHLHDVFSSLMRLRSNPLYTDVFISDQIEKDLGGAFKWLKVTKDAASLMVIGNFDVVSQPGTVTFPTSGIWYDYLNGTTIIATGAPQSITLQPGEYHVYLNSNAALPVTLINFSGKNNGSNNVLSWAVTNEQNLARYELQRSTDGQHYSFVADINASGMSNYNYADNISGDIYSTIFYRLKSIDKDGRINYSAVVKIRMSAKDFFIDINPNPFRDKLNVNIESHSKDRATLLLADLSGRQLIKKNILLLQGNNAYEIKETSGLSNGAYLLTIITPAKTQSIKVIKRN
ncbi:MAG: alpha-amylase family glycosyl hydrolase [Ginsengibacter sp.]